MEAAKLTMVNRDKERCHEVTERARMQVDLFVRDSERKLAEKLELMSENKEANIRSLQHRLRQHVSHCPPATSVLLHTVTTLLLLTTIIIIRIFDLHSVIVL